MSNTYILVDKKPVLENDIHKWAMWYEDSRKERVVEKTSIKDADISTVFLGLDHGFDGKVLLYETMIFGGELDGECWRYETLEEAIAGHHEACKQVIG